MKIEIWSDIACPFCYIGKRKLEEALTNFPKSEQVEVEFKSYQLDPQASPYTGQNVYETMAMKFGSLEQVKQMTENVTMQAKQVGLDFDFDSMKPTNTFSAHRLTKFAKTHGKDLEISEKLLQAHFIDGEDVGAIDALVEIAKEAGLDEDETRAVLENEQAYAKEVQADITEAKQFNITGVPFFIINRKYAISGAQPVETFIQALEKVYEEENATPAFEDLSATSDTICGDDGCAIPKDK